MREFVVLNVMPLFFFFFVFFLLITFHIFFFFFSFFFFFFFFLTFLTQDSFEIKLLDSRGPFYGLGLFVSWAL
jgi:hypothetical protein